MSDDKPKSKLLQFLEEGGDEDQLATTVRLLEELTAASKRKDTKAMAEIWQQLTALVKEKEARKKELRATMDTACQHAYATADPDDRTAKLVAAFEIAAKAQYQAYDVLDDKDTGDEAIRQAHNIAAALDAIPPGRRSALASFLDNADAGVRVMAAVHLQKMMPERANPILREIDENHRGTSIGLTAFWSLPRDRASAETSNSGNGKEGAEKP